MARMFDSTAPAGIPAAAGIPDYVLGYVDGEWPTAAQIAAKYPTAIPVSLSAIPGSVTALTAEGFDGERGDYDPAQGAAFAKEKLAAGVVPIGYCSLATWPAYADACTDAGVPGFLVDWVIAAYPGIGPVLYNGAVGHQFVDYGPYDESVVLDGWVPGRSITVPTTPEPVAAGLYAMPEAALGSVTAAAAIRFYYRFALLREMDPGGYTAQAGYLAGGGTLDGVLSGLQDSPEGQAVIAAVRQANGL